VGALAGEMIKPSVLELGGSDAFIVMPSADLEAAARVATTARCQNSGQSCIAAKRFIVHETIADEFERRFVEHMSALTVGDPFESSTDVGPLATSSGRDEVEELVADAVAKGAKVLCGGERLAGPGWYYPPTVISELTPEMRMYTEEVFGPVAGLFRVGSLEEAIEVANATEFGLGANAWTNDEDERTVLVRDLAAGAVFINGMVTSYPELPFGGIKTSGYGRELSAQGIRAFCNLKTVWVGRD
jgi:succinate-semialdehyde dehydrogenase / glutarate-semialdehyde dehydrogenase